MSDSIYAEEQGKPWLMEVLAVSNVNIRRVVENIRTITTVYTPVLEIVVNAIQAIDESGRPDGRIQVCVHRSNQLGIEDGLPEVTGLLPGERHLAA